MRLAAIDIVFFFQAEDGIRDYKVTGVQTCALPICAACTGAVGSPPDAASAATPITRTPPVMASPRLPLAWRSRPSDEGAQDRDHGERVEAGDEIVHHDAGTAGQRLRLPGRKRLHDVEDA